jgi:predicted Zn-dependent protease with MMP-like domain
MEKQFEQYVKEAIDNIPKKYLDKMKHVAIMIEEEPTFEQKKRLGLRHCDALYGLYEGIPLPKRGGATLSVVPDRITIFKHPMVDIFLDPTMLKAQVNETLWHEVAHFFGLNHTQIHKAKKNQIEKQ